MEYEQVKEWLDKLVDNINQQFTLQNFNNQIRTYTPDKYIFIHEGIDIIADVIGVELSENVTEGTYRYSLIYRGIEFLQTEKERLASYVHMQ